MNAGKQHVALASLAVTVLLGLAACGPVTEDNPPASSSGGTQATAVSCANGTVTGSGSSAQKIAMEVWIDAYQRACDGSSISYQSVGSSTGLQQFIDGQTSFGGSDSPLQGATKTQADARCTSGAMDLPMVLGPIAVIYTLAGVDDLQLSPATLAKIFSTKITRWDDPAIKAENPGVTLPSTAISAVHRSDGSGTTDNFTSFLKGAAASAWTYGAGFTWPAPGGTGATGNEDVAATVRATAGAIGYVELFFAENAGLLTAKIKNAAGEYVGVSADAASIGLSTAMLAESTDLTLTFDYATPTLGAYPIYLVTYEIVCTEGLPPAQAALLKSFLTYTSSPAGQQEISNIGYAPLPQRVASRVRGAVASLS